MNEFNPNRKEYDPRMHSAEHILNQTMIRMFDCGRTINAHIEAKKSRIDFRLPRCPSPEKIAEIEQRVNRVIQDDLPITEHFLTREEAAAMVSLARLPEDAGNTIRIVKVGDYDVCPCSGPHVKSTKEIGEFKIASTDYQNDVLRIRFRLNSAPDELSGTKNS
jgi:misacylated tRNA(Ala) deacylase